MQRKAGAKDGLPSSSTRFREPQIWAWECAVSSTGVSLDIDIEEIAEVLLADGWHVVYGRSFALDDFDFTLAGRRVRGGGDSGVCSTGFSFVTDEAGSRIAGPLTSILALRHGVAP
jgi:hypothetical protein